MIKNTLIDILHIVMNLLYIGLITMNLVMGIKYKSAYYMSLAIFFYIVESKPKEDK